MDPERFQGLFSSAPTITPDIPKPDPADIAALRTLLERLFPNVDISGAGVALLAAQIAEKENFSELLHSLINDLPNRNAAQIMGLTDPVLTGAVNRLHKYEPNNYSK